MKPLNIIEKYYKPDSRAYEFLIEHSKSVVKKALTIAKQVKYLNPDLEFIGEAAMLHDIGIFLTKAPEIECYGRKPYICHGYLGREILEKEGLSKHGLVCERHIGVGITTGDIEKYNLPLPKRDMKPVSIEEQIICFADKFFSKFRGHLSQEKQVEQIKNSLSKFGKDKVQKFEHWLKLFDVL